MARPLRIEYENAWYHVMNRGSGKKTIFRRQEHYQLFLKLLEEINDRYQIETHAYCLMSNHYHLLIKTPLPNLSKGMRHLNGIYVQRFNKSLGTDGPLFRGRFKSIVVDTENYLLRLSRYIHLNPLKANMVKKAEDYLWSSYADYLGNRIKPFWLNTEEILNYFNEQKSTYTSYKNFIDGPVDKEIENFYKKTRYIPILGTDKFVKLISEKYLDNGSIHYEIPEHKNMKKLNFPNVEGVMIIIAQYYQVNFDYLKKVRKGVFNKPRNVAIYLTTQLCQKNNSEIASHFGKISYSSISNITSRIMNQLKKDEKLQQEIHELIRLIK